MGGNVAKVSRHTRRAVSAPRGHLNTTYDFRSLLTLICVDR
jgi:hypothetical protein